MVAPAALEQMDPQGLKEVGALFNKQMADGLHPGACLAAYRHGSLVLDLWGGMSDPDEGKAVNADTMFVMYSNSKALTAGCIYILWERGLLQWDDPVARYWPNFANNGKDGITIRHILTHRGGIPETPPEIVANGWADWDLVVRAMEGASPTTEPGAVIAYQQSTFGWVLGELVRRIDGRPIGQFLKEEITAPLSMNDVYMGLPAELEDRVSRIHAMEDAERVQVVDTFNKPEVHQAVNPAAGGIGTARDLVRYYAMLGCGGVLDDVRILKPETVQEVTKQQAEGHDHTFNVYVHRSLGLWLADSRMGSSGGDPARTFGHGGIGTSVGWADPDVGLAVAYITNGLRANTTHLPRMTVISQAVRDACL